MNCFLVKKSYQKKVKFYFQLFVDTELFNLASTFNLFLAFIPEIIT